MFSPRDQGFSRLAIKNGFMTRAQVEEVFSALAKVNTESQDSTTFEEYVVEHNLMSGSEAAAVALAYQRLIKEFADQADVAAQARGRLVAMQADDGTSEVTVRKIWGAHGDFKEIQDENTPLYWLTWANCFPA